MTITRPHGLLRAGYPYLRTLGMRRVTNFPADIAFSGTGDAYILMRSAGAATVRVWPLDDMDRLTDELIGFGAYGAEDGQLTWPVQIITNSAGDIFISDEATHRISRFNQDREFVSKWGVEGDSDGELNGPTGIAFDPVFAWRLVALPASNSVALRSVFFYRNAKVGQHLQRQFNVRS